MKWTGSIILAGLVVACGAASVAEAADTKGIFDATGVRGGLVVHLGCGDGKLTASLRASDSYIVHGLDADAKNVEAARKHAASLGLYGSVSIAQWTAQALPYADNLVNLLVARDLGGATMDEVMRVLVPEGVALVGGKKTVKPRPNDIDDWTHFLHDATNNAVARDARVGPPRRLQWTAGPPWCRSHEFISSFSAMVSAGGRVFYVMDYGQPGVTDKRMPERWVLSGRDAFNGVLLWRRELRRWRSDDEWKNTSMRGRPGSVPRRIVADDKHLYATLSHRGGVSVLDPATGRTLREIKGTRGAQELLLSARTLVLRLAGTGQGADATKASIAAVDADTGKILWQRAESGFYAQSLAAGDGCVVYDNQKETVCLNLADGKDRWRAAGAVTPEPAARPKGKAKGKARPKRRRSRDLVLIIHSGLVLDSNAGSITARDAKTGKIIWTTRTGGRSMRAHDFFIARGCAWHAAGDGIAGYDLKTGKVVKTLNPTSVQSKGHHLRCYRAKATERYLITQFRGAEFVSLTDDNHSQNDWLRGPCRYGIMPCNGMLYTPPHQCFCFAGVMRKGLGAYTTATDDELRAIGSAPAGDRLKRGPAYNKTDDRKSKIDSSKEWPVYRHDARRTGSAACEVPAQLDIQWRTKLGGQLTPPVSAGGRIYLAVKDQHAVCSLRAADGALLWRFTAGAGIDSPPTVHKGLVLFGCDDGWVYCLRASDGELAWRFRAAPAQRLVMDDGRLASAWRAHGSVMVYKGVAYCTAGRSTWLDGGLYLYGLDPSTGKVVHTGRLDTTMATRRDAVGKPFLPAFHIEGTRSDIFVAQGGYLYLNQVKLTIDLKQVKTPYVPHDKNESITGLDVANVPYVADNPYLKNGFAKAAALGVSRGHMGDQEVGMHLFTTGGFLEDSWFNRTFWMYAATWPGYQLAHIAPKTGQLVVVGETTSYAVQAYPSRNVHSAMFTPQSKGYLLIADSNDNEPMMDHRSWHRDKGMGFTRKAPPKWHEWIPIRMRSMVLAGERLFVAGEPDVLDEKDPMAAFDGRKGALLRAVSAENGKKLAEYKLDFPPVFDGLIAADGRLYVVTIDGSVRCYGAKK